MSILRFVLVVCAGLAAACGGGTVPVPTTPSTAPTQTVNNSIRAIVIDGPRLIPPRSDVTYLAAAVLDSGARVNNVRPTVWATDDPATASIRSAPDGVGELSARRPGIVAITASYQGKTGTTTVEVRDPSRTAGGANIEISYDPNPARGRQAPCAAFGDPSVPSWRFTETIAETAGVGFTQDTFTFNLYSALETVIYTETEIEQYYYEPHSVYREEFCTSLFGAPAGFYTDIIEGVDDRGTRMAFGNERLRLLAVDSPPSVFQGPWWTSIGPLTIPPPGTRILVRTNRQRIR